MRASLFPAVFGLTLMLASGAASAQESGASASGAVTVSEAPSSIFSRLFQHPTGNNGYEEWVRAVDLIQNDENVDAAMEPGASLNFKRHVLADPSATQALILLREGANKPVRSPRQSVDENTLLPELAPFRRLARLLSVQMQVDFAEGRASAAIADLRTGLVFGDRIQTDTLISGLVGVAIDAVVLNGFAPHFDQLSASQCDQVLQIVAEGLNAECPAIRLLALEKGHTLKMLDARRSDPDSMLALLDTLTNGDESGNGNPEEADALQNLQARLIDRPQDLNPIIDDAQARTVALFNQAILDLRVPITQRKPLPIDRAASPGYWLFRSVNVNMQPLLDKYDTAQEKLRLLGVHALIRRYFLEHKTLPTSLAQLHATDLVLDPFTGDSLLYQRNGDLYTLSSRGPLKLDPAGHAVSKERNAIKLQIATR
jgi:hypothetical protein